MTWVLVAVWIIVYIVASSRESLSPWTHLLMLSVFAWSVYAFRLPALIRGDATHASARRQSFVDKTLRPIRYQKESNKPYLQMRPSSSPLRYIPWHPDLVDLLEALHFTRRWDSTHYDEVVTFTERFLAAYYKALDKSATDAARDFPIVRDLRRELLNAMGSLVSNVPQVSKVTGDALPPRVSRLLQEMQALTRNKLRLLSGWIRQGGGTTAGDTLRYMPPWPANDMDVAGYGMY